MKHKILTVIFVLSWFAVFAITGSLDQYIISIEQAVVPSIIVFAAMGISGFISGLLTLPKPRDKFDHKK